MGSHKSKPTELNEKAGLPAREAAVRLMTAVVEDHRLMAELLPDAVQHLSPSDRARAQRLATEALRWASRSDRALGPYVRRKPEPFILNVLRLAVWECLADKAQPHGVVDSAVSIARTENPKATGMVNAVLRNILRDKIDWSALPPPQLPKWLRKELIAQYGKETVQAIEFAHANGAPLDLTARNGLEEAVARETGGTRLATGSIRLFNQPKVSGLPGYDDGGWWVQDAAAALPARLLDVNPGERVLDLCAAPGGKTMQMADAGGDIVALDVSGPRLDRLRQNLARTGLSADIVQADALHWSPTGLFDAILLDAPCSATGTIRRHPDLPFAKSGAEIEELVPLQARLLDLALGWLKPGGRLVYCVCSLLQEEGEQQLAAARARHPSLKVLPSQFAGVQDAWKSQDGGLRLRPDFLAEEGGMDGFFAVALQKPA